MNTTFTFELWQVLVYSILIFVGGTMVPDSVHEKSRVPAAIAIVVAVVLLIAKGA